MFEGFIDSTEKLEFGMLIAVVIVALLLFALNSLIAKKQLNVLSYIIGLVLAALLTFQFSKVLMAYEMSETLSNLSKITDAISPTLNKYLPYMEENGMGWYVFRRILWSVIFLVLGGFAIYITMDKKKTKSRGIPSGAQMGRRYNQVPNRRHR